MAVMQYKRKYRQIASKGLKHVVMWQHPHLRSCLPETIWYSEENIKKMLKQSPSVFVKPDKGGGGSGIIRVRKLIPRFEVCFRKNCRMVEERDLGRMVGRLLLPLAGIFCRKGWSWPPSKGGPSISGFCCKSPGTDGSLAEWWQRWPLGDGLSPIIVKAVNPWI